MKKFIGTLCVSIFFAVQISAQITGDFSAFPFLQTTQVSAKQANQYVIVDFIINNEVQTDSLAIASGELIPEPAEPTKTGATFVGWYTEKTGGEKWDFKTSVMPEKKLVLYARFKEVNGTIFLASNRTKIMMKTTKDTSSFDVISAFGVKAVDTVDEDLIEKGMFAIEGLEKLDLTTAGIYELTFSVTNSVGNKESLLLTVDVQESFVTGIIFEDTINFNSKNDEKMYFNDVLVSLIDIETNMPVAQTRTAMDGSYELGIPNGVTTFKLKVDTPKGYIQAPKAFDSVFNDLGESDIFTTHGNDFKQVNIGFAKAVRVSVSSTGVDFKIHEQKKVDITISNGSLLETNIADSSLFSIEQTHSGLVLTNLAQGETAVHISYKDVYGRPAAPQSVIVIKSA